MLGSLVSSLGRPRACRILSQLATYPQTSTLVADGALATIQYSDIAKVVPPLSHPDRDVPDLVPLLAEKDLLANNVETIEINKSGLCLLRLINTAKVGVNRTLWIDLPTFKALLETEVEAKDRKQALQVGIMAAFFIFAVIRNL
jgi:hypothetical protein